MKLNMMFVYRGFGPALRDFDKKTYYLWSYFGQDSVLDDFLSMYCAGGEL